MAIQFVDLKKQYASIKPEIDEAIRRVIESSVFIGGTEIEGFEEEFAKFCEASNSIGVGSGTAALEMIYRTLPIGPGDEVIVQANTYISSAYAISAVGATPILVDCDPKTYNMSAELVKEKITPKTKAICITHLYGQSADMDPLMALAKEKNLIVIEDACQAHGSRYKGKRVGSFGLVSAFSFYPGKNLGAYGDGGAITTNDATLAQELKLLCEFGQTQKYVHIQKGTNSRLDALQAAILRVKLTHLEKWNARRRELAAYYSKKLSEGGFQTPFVQNDTEHVFHVYVIEVERRDELLQYMKSNGIHCNIHYPIPVHLQEAYRELGYKEGAFPVAERAAKRIISLPMYPELTETEIDTIVTTLSDFYRS